MSADAPEVAVLAREAIAADASDLHLVVGEPPAVRVDGELRPLAEHGPLCQEDLKRAIASLFGRDKREMLVEQRRSDAAWTIDDTRVRLHAFYASGVPVVALRFIPRVIRSIEELQLPSLLHSWGEYDGGLVLVCGPVGSGKSTTLAAIVDEVNRGRGGRIITLENPIEYVHASRRATVSQREVEIDTPSWEIGLEDALREDLDLLLIGELRNRSVMSTALEAAEAGRLVLSTLHSPNAVEAIFRFIGAFPDGQRDEIRTRLAASLRAILGQRLLRHPSGRGRRAACEALVATHAIRASIRNGASPQNVRDQLQSGGEEGMFTIDHHLADLVSEGAIVEADALRLAVSVEDFQARMHRRMTREAL